MKELEQRLHSEKEFSQSNQRSLYQEVLEEVMGPCRSKSEEQLLEASHMVEVNEKLLECVVEQYRHLTDYMICEINVLEAERREIKGKYDRKLTEVMEIMSLYTDNFSRTLTPPTAARRRASLATEMPCSAVSHKNPVVARRRHSMFACVAPDSDDDNSSVLSDLSMSVASVFSNHGVKSVATSETATSNSYSCTGVEDFTSMRQPALIPEEEKFTVIKL
jgi:hypothetical protein